MKDLDLFPRQSTVGIFRGFQQGGLEFHADVVLPYRNEFQNIPMHGQFVLVQLETPDEAVLGRITSFSSDGKLAIGSGEEFNIRAARENRPVPEDLREQYLKYRVNIRVLGVLSRNGSGLTFVASHRRLPHVGSPVAFPSPEVLREIAGHNINGAAVGHLAYGEFIYAGDKPEFEVKDWMKVLSPEISVRFPVDSLVSRRSFIFARAGFGKSNLNKLLFSRLYRETPTVEKRGGKRVPVGTVVFDPDGEYFWPDDKGRPALCDVPELEDKLVVFTPRVGPSAFYQSFVAGGIKLDIRRLRPGDVIAIALGPERQEQQNVRKLRALSQERWEQLVNLIDVNRNAAPLEDVCRLLDLDPEKQEAEALAARGNMTAIVGMLHDRSSQLMDLLIHALSLGKLCVVDISQMRGAQSLVLSGLILRRIFDRNQQEFTNADPKTIPTIAVVEEAQSVLNESATASEPYIAWIKEGRKYDLGALLITQQPGSIPVEILSQGDNWFIFHLLSAADLFTLKKANAHFSDDLLSSLLNEPIAGHGLFWSSVGGKPYPVSIRTLLFERLYQVRDPKYNAGAAHTCVRALRDALNGTATAGPPTRQLATRPATGATQAMGHQTSIELPPVEGGESEEREDVLQNIEDRAIEALRNDESTLSRIRSEQGIAWGMLRAFLATKLPEHLDDRLQVAYHLVPKAMDRLFGPQRTAWNTYKNQAGTTYVRLIGARQ